MSGQIEFVQNNGQWHSNVQYKANVPGGSIFLENKAFTYRFYDADLVAQLHLPDPEFEMPEFISRHAFQVEFLGSSNTQLSGEKEKSNYYNFYLSDNEDEWQSEVPCYEKVRYPDLYDGIDMVIYQKENTLKYDFLLEPGAAPEQIRMGFKGVDDIFIKEGEFHLKTSLNELIELEPYAFQFIDGKIIEIECQFKLEYGELFFELGEYDNRYKLTIDPEITFSTFVGASSDNFGATATNDSEGNLIGAATVFGNNYPLTFGAEQDLFSGGYTDCAITKFSADGTDVLYSSFLGGSANEIPHSLICDQDDNIILIGTTGSPDFPTTLFAYQTENNGGPSIMFSSLSNHVNGCDLFISKFTEAGTGLSASTFLGGDDTDGLNFGEMLHYNYGDLFRGEVITDEDNNIIVATVTASGDFPMEGGSPISSNQGGETDAVVFKLDPSLTDLIWSSYLGGGGADAAYSVQLNSNNDYVVAGGTKSSDFPFTSGADDTSFNGEVDGFICIFSEDGNDIDYCTFNGTSEYNQNYFVQLDMFDNIYVIGQTEGNMPIIGDVYNNPGSGQFISKFNSDLSSLEWQTTIGTGSGEIDISPTAFLVSDCDQIYFSGWGGATNQFNSPYANSSSTTGMPITGDAFQSDTDGSDFYLAVLTAEASQLSYATFFGGDVSNEHVDGGTSKFDKNGSVYQAVCAGCGGNSDFPSTPDVWSPTNPSSNCNLGVFKFDLATLNASISIDGPSEVCEGQAVQFNNYSIGGTDYEWDFGDGFGSAEFEPEHIFEDFGEFEVSLIVTHINDCIDPDTTSIFITILEGVDPYADVPDLICSGGTVQLQGYGTDNLYWLDDPTLSDTDISNPTATPDVETTYYLVDFNDCESDTVAVEVLFYSIITNISEDDEICIGSSIDLFVEGGVSYQWSPEEYLNNPDIQNPTATPDTTTTFVVTILTEEGCEIEDDVTIEVVVDFPGGNVYPDVGTCIGEPIMLEALDGYSWSWTPTEYLDDPFSQTPIANPPVTTTYFVEVSNICGTGTDELTVLVITPSANAGSDGTICEGTWHPVWATGGEEYYWTPPIYAEDPHSAETNVSPPETMEMIVYVTDEYGCTASAEVSVNVLPAPYVFAGHDQFVDWGEEILLFGSSDGVQSYWTPPDQLSCSECPTPELQPTESGYFVYHTIDELGCASSDSVYIDVFYPIYIPNAFTPNGDGINDFFFVDGVNIREYKLEIWNRWGELVFESTDPSEPWDGSKEGGDHFVQDGIYVWTVTYKVKSGHEKLIGHVSLTR